MEFSFRLPEEGCSYHATVLISTSPQTVAAIDDEALRKRPKGILLPQDNAAPHKAAISYQQLGDLHSTALNHPAHSPDVAPSDYRLLPNIKEHIKWRKICSPEEATLAADGRFSAKAKEFFLLGLKKIKEQSH
jgi:hypothetical protein